MFDGDSKVPQQTTGDVVHGIIKAGISVIPVIGSPAAELFTLVIQPPLEKRRQAWMEEIAAELQQLRDSKVSYEDLRDNDEFLSSIMHATQIALRTHQKEKLEALRKAVLNVARGQAPEQALQLMFLNLVDVFTEWHVRILRLFRCPPPQPGVYMGGLSQVLEGVYPELKGRRDFYDQVWRDLHLRGLTNTDSLHATMTASGLTQKRTSSLGDQFLSFIE